MEKINAKLEFGIFVGVKRSSSEVMVAALKGIEHVRSVRRVPFEHRWGDDNTSWVRWAPWNEYRDCPNADGDVPEGVPAEEGLTQKSGDRERVVIVDTREKIPREFYITHENAKEHGYTRGCAGCSSWFRGTP